MSAPPPDTIARLAALAAQPAAPVVKWVGGKTKLLPELLRRVPRAYGRYFEPFAGGAALFFRLAPARAVLNDLNPDLVNLYRELARDVFGVAKLLHAHEILHRADPNGHYYELRRLWNARDLQWTPAQRAAAFLYLNKTCFNGLWRVNSDGEFNVPMGDYKNPKILDTDALSAAGAALARAELRCGDYKAALEGVAHGDFVYFDPPYVPLNATSFTSYTANGFGPDEQRELAACASGLAARGVFVMLSNSDTPFTREMYGDYGFRLEGVKCGRSINARGDGRGKVDELIITNYAPPADS